MKRLISSIMITFAFVLVSALAYAGHTATLTGKATLHPINQSGIKARINFVDDGTTLMIEGTATGLTPGQNYVSLIYDNGSVPGGPTACEPTNATLTGKMLVGFWTVNPDGIGTLSVTNLLNETNPPTFAPSSYVPITDFQTISIRHVESGFSLQACGVEATHKGS